MVYIAHVKKILNSDEWDKVHVLEEHLLKTAKLAQEVAPEGAELCSYLAGKWHDLGKYREKFQHYIRYKSGYEREHAHIENSQRAPHSTAGAIHAVNNLPPFFGYILAYVIAGHHAGLPDWYGGRSSLKYRLKDGQVEYEQAMQELIPDEILENKELVIPDYLQDPELIPLWIRLLFSSLVDADFRDTESYMDSKKTKLRKNNLSLNELSQRFEESMKKLEKISKNGKLMVTRNQILQSCNQAADWKPGIFSLTVPTGGGKTLSSLSFALNHAKIYNKRRIVYAIPFTSIIEQNAKVFKEFLGEEAVLEHHSSLDVKPESEHNKARLAAENWDAPLIVTTNVQLFESLFASKTSRCRKLHNLVNSIIILDEAQQIPRDFQEPIVKVMQQMADHFGVTWVLCTATQPDLGDSKDNFGRTTFSGLKNVREIISNPEQLAYKLKRVEVKMPQIDTLTISSQELAKQLSREVSVLAIVNTRNQARQLYEHLPLDGNNLHLSANMCAEHRTKVIDQIKERLEKRRKGEGRPLRVISTQLIEAGVDVDFPIVYRAMAGLDSIAQSAGRCNREGKLPLGKVIVFKPEQPSPPGFLRQAEDATLSMIGSGLLDDPLSPASFKRYFKELNGKGDRDKHGIFKEFLKVNVTQKGELGIQFRSAAEKFRLIDDAGVPVIVPFKSGKDEVSPVYNWLEELEKNPLQRWAYRKLQRYTVSLPEHRVNEMVKKGIVDELVGHKVLLGCYFDEVLGVRPVDALIAPDKSII